MRRVLTISVVAGFALGLSAFAGPGGQQKGGGSDRTQEPDTRTDPDGSSMGYDEHP